MKTFFEVLESSWRVVFNSSSFDLRVVGETMYLTSYNFSSDP